MSAIDDKIASIAALQETTAKQLSLLLTRDPAKEFGYGPQYDPKALKRFQSNQWAMLLVPGTATGVVFTAPNIVEEITVVHSIGGSPGSARLLRVELDDNNQFKNIPANFATRTLYVPPVSVVANGANWNYFFNTRLPCVLRWIRVTLVSDTGAALAWNPATVLNLGFHGQ